MLFVGNRTQVHVFPLVVYAQVVEPRVLRNANAYAFCKSFSRSAWFFSVSGYG